MNPDKTSTYKGKAMDINSADGVALFSTAHTSKVDGVANQSNKSAGNATEQNAGTYFSSDLLAKAETIMQNITDDTGEIAGIAPDTIIIPNDATLKTQVFGVLGAINVPESSNNAFNFLVGRYTVIISQYLNKLITSTDKPFMLFDSTYNNSVDGLIYQNRENLRVRAYTENKTENIVFAGADRHCYAAVDWRAIAVFNVTGGSTLS